jgi:hypothetical protein
VEKFTKIKISEIEFESIQAFQDFSGAAPNPATVNSLAD